MGRRTAQSFDDASFSREGVLASAGASFASTIESPAFNLTVNGVFNGELVLERSFDGGANWVGVARDNTGLPIRIYGVVSLSLYEPEAGMNYRLRAVSLTSGAAQVRFSGGW